MMMTMMMMGPRWVRWKERRMHEVYLIHPPPNSCGISACACSTRGPFARFRTSCNAQHFGAADSAYTLAMARAGA